MRVWEKPIAGTHLFTANDYVSACSMKIMCNCTLPKDAIYVRVPEGNTVDFNNDGTIEGRNTLFRACWKDHDANTDTEFFYYDFTEGMTNLEDVVFDAPVTLAMWREIDASGNVVDVHITDPANVSNAESNKS